MNNPKLTALLAAVGSAYFGYSIFGTSEGVNPLLNIINWSFFALALVAFGGSLFKILRG
jgi:hypothetical protein